MELCKSGWSKSGHHVRSQTYQICLVSTACNSAWASVCRIKDTKSIAETTVCRLFEFHNIDFFDSLSSAKDEEVPQEKQTMVEKYAQEEKEHDTTLTAQCRSCRKSKYVSID